MADTVSITVNGRLFHARSGITVAAALADAGTVAVRTSVGGEPRAMLCGMGICYECRATVDGVTHQRTCMITVREGLRIDTASASGGDHV